MSLKRELPGARVAEVMGAVALILWRVWKVPVADLWRDWVLLLVVFWLLDLCAPSPRAARWISVVLMACLLALYGTAHVPFLLPWIGSPS